MMGTLVVKDVKADKQRGKRLCPAPCLSGGLLALLVLGLCFGSVRTLHAEPASGNGATDWRSKRLAKQMTAAKPVAQTLPSTLDNSLKSLVYLFAAAAFCLPAALVIYFRRLPPTPKLKAPTPAPAPAELDPAIQSLFRDLVMGLSNTGSAQVAVEAYDPVPRQLDKIAKLFGQFHQVTGPAESQKVLSELARAFFALKESCTAPGLRVMWQCASLLEALIRQVARKQSEATHSCLRTVAGGIDLLRKLTDAGKLDDNLLTDPPVKVLAVDDNAVCLSAAAMALKNAFPGVDLAADGETSLRLTQAASYDAIFLDVEMPGMDGFELCSKIHQTSKNEKTPVIFVTAHRDFDSRAKSAECGGYELIGKPFLPLEIAFKAFALITDRRLQNTGRVATADSNCKIAIQPVVATAAKAAGESKHTEHRKRESFAPSPKQGIQGAGA